LSVDFHQVFRPSTTRITFLHAGPGEQADDQRERGANPLSSA